MPGNANLIMKRCEVDYVSEPWDARHLPLLNHKISYLSSCMESWLLASLNNISTRYFFHYFLYPISLLTQTIPWAIDIEQVSCDKLVHMYGASEKISISITFQDAEIVENSQGTLYKVIEI